MHTLYQRVVGMSMEKATTSIQGVLSDCGGGDNLAANVTIPERLKRIQEVTGVAVGVYRFKCLLHLCSNLASSFDYALQGTENVMEEVLKEIEGSALQTGILFKQRSLIVSLGYLVCKILHPSFADGYNLNTEFIKYLRTWNKDKAKEDQIEFVDLGLVNPRGSRFDDSTHNISALNIMLKTGILKGFFTHMRKKNKNQSRLFNALESTLVKDTKLHFVIQAVSMAELSIIRPLDEARVRVTCCVVLCLRGHPLDCLQTHAQSHTCIHHNSSCPRTRWSSVTSCRTS